MWTLFGRISLLVTLAGIVSVNQAQDTTPTRTAKNGSLIGWFLAPTSTQKMTASDVWITKDDYAGACSTSDVDQCSLPTACEANTLTWDNEATAVCAPQYSCVTFTIFETSPAGLPSASSVGCWQGWSAWTVYRTRPDDPASTRTTTTTTDTTTTTATEATPTPTDGSEDVDSGNDSSGQGRIAGAVVGPIAGAAIIGAVVFFYLRSKKHLLTAPVQQVYYQEPYYGPAQAAPNNVVSLGTSELANAQYRYGPTGAATEMRGLPVAEMPSTRQTHELSSRW
ncbi:EGFR-like transmembrane domain-containing protein [Aspergillus puulaauensis]|uniref:Mid2 domain-containing protein n=1 Tax=Aspergillus puulaauensis TaxID=1220207 RepID=A0A7R7XZP3_9EURO|nr:uncharacterized protein APUU_80211A [Aspergillus puulaauensis]BCS29908.1 hypothetical protein APUU_80211A [Aspergillus puulaauensis]